MRARLTWFTTLAHTCIRMSETNKYEGATPGKWSDWLDDSGHSAMYAIWSYAPRRTRRITLVLGDSDEDKANAALIADAPELLRQRDALLAALKEIAGYASLSNYIQYISEMKNIAREAIAATKGGA